MNLSKLAQALTNLADALYEASEALTEQPAVAGTTAGPAQGRVPSAPAGLAGGEGTTLPAGLPEIPPLEEVLYADELAAEQLPPQGSEAVCPAHHKPFKEGKFGLFCPEKGIEPRWTNARGYCQITPKNVAIYQRQHAAVPA